MPMLLEVDPVNGGIRGRHVAADATVLVPAMEWLEDSDHGLLLTVESEPEPRFAAARLIAVDFPVFHDGRGLSLAVLLRTRIGFTGELRAIGDVHPELVHYLRRSGFDSFLLPPHRTLGAEDARLTPYSRHYQASVADPLPAFRRQRGG